MKPLDSTPLRILLAKERFPTRLTREAFRVRGTEQNDAASGNISTILFDKLPGPNLHSETQDVKQTSSQKNGDPIARIENDESVRGYLGILRAQEYANPNACVSPQ
jgi:hypothetical protein